MSDKERYYETNIINPTIKVVALSDIHGDIQSFIISLRDCAKVIRKKTPTVDTDAPALMKYKEFSSDKYDENMEQILLLDLNTDEDKYIEDLNYEWCGDNTHVVICGDIIDPYRKSLAMNCIKTAAVPCSYYPQIELKILMFINILNEQARPVGGKIIKLLGNHELGNIIPLNPEVYKEFIYEQDRNTQYYKGTSRELIFTVGQHGFNLLFKDGCGVLIKINNTIFVHGNLMGIYDVYDKFNQFINNPKYQETTSQQKWEELFISSHSNHPHNGAVLDSFLNINRGDYNYNLEDSTATEVNVFCNDLLKSFKHFKGNSSIITEKEDTLQLVIGHCPQYELSAYSDNQLSTTYKDSKTYSYKIENDSVREVFGNTTYSGQPNFLRTDNRTKIFGITMECLIPDKSEKYRVYRIDVGSSRGFDNYINRPYPRTLEEENKFLYSKTPQILEINTNGRINIIKSTMRNTRIHLQRPHYESSIKDIEELNINTNTHDYYKYKYLKYKNKYLQLKQT